MNHPIHNSSKPKFCSFQLNPVNKNVFLILGEIYMELYEMFNFDDFHFGGTDISFNCWNSSSAVTSYMLQRDYLADLDEEGRLDTEVSS